MTPPPSPPLGPLPVAAALDAAMTADVGQGVPVAAAAVARAVRQASTGPADPPTPWLEVGGGFDTDPMAFRLGVQDNSDDEGDNVALSPVSSSHENSDW
jgi:hypothetical protein